MSQHARLRLTAHKDLDLPHLLHALTTHSPWSYNINGQLRYRVLEEWEETPHKSDADTLITVGNLLQRNHSLSLQAISTEDPQEIIDLHYQKTEPDTLRITLNTRRSLSPNYPIAIDFSWFITRLTPALDASRRDIILLEVEAAHTDPSHSNAT